jgi:tRNA-splicing ligase RtcB
VADLERETAGIECRKDAGMLDEAPSANTSIDAVMAAGAELVDIVCTSRQVVCVKGWVARIHRA